MPAVLSEADIVFLLFLCLSVQQLKNYWSEICTTW